MIDALEIAGLAVSRGGRGLFAGLDFRLGRGEAAALTGPNGAGKTSLLRAVAGLLRPDGGTIAFAGAPSADEARSRALHMIGHQDGLKAQRTAWEELRFQTLWCGGTEATARAAAASLELERLLDLDVRRLSAGQRRRLALARLVAAPRDLWLLDEPMAPLDAKFRDRFAAMLAAHLDGGGLALVAVHDPLPGATRSLEIGG